MNRARRPFVLDEAVDILSRTPATLDAMLRDLPQSWGDANEGGDTWSPADVVGHLTFADLTNWVPRARVVLQHGELVAFDDFDRLGHVKSRAEHTLDSRLDEFEEVRQGALRKLGALGLASADLDRRGRHPAFGPVTLRQLLAAWVVHDLDHVFQISRVLARQYTDEIGPWREYLRIVRDAPV
jgi:hypothetical protein